MPTYEYKCTNCRLAFDVRRSMSDDSPVVCPKCSSPAQRVFSRVGIVFKADGFYSTDGKRSWWQKPGMDEAMSDAESVVDKSLRGN